MPLQYRHRPLWRKRRVREGRGGRCDTDSVEYEPLTRSEFEPSIPERPALPQTRRPPRQSWLRRRLGPVLAGLAALLTKLKAILLFLPKLKLLTTAGTMFVSIAAYGLIWGLPFAAGFVLLLLVHELGHVIELRRQGIRASAPMFIPFLGAVISARTLGENALAEAQVGLAGPVLGSLGAVACIPLWHATGNDMFRALAFTGFFLNLFNLIPVSPFDGGRAMAAMSPRLWALGVAVMVIAGLTLHNVFVLVFALIGARSSWQRWKAIKAGGEEAEAYYRVRAIDRLLVAAVYLSLVALLVTGMHATLLDRSLP
jgi:Zn-dependent protease